MSVQVSYKKQFFLSIFLFLIILGIAEGSSRLYEFVDPHCDFLKSDVMKKVDPFLKNSICYDHNSVKWYFDVIPRYVPDQHFQTININSHGFRGPEINYEKNDDTYRIFMIGGSTTFGSGASSDETTIPGFLQKFFDNVNLPKNVEVINAGIGGAGSAEEKFYVENVLLDFNPDLLIIYDGVNDVGSGTLIEVYDEEGNVVDFESGMSDDSKNSDITQDDKIRFQDFSFYRTPFVIHKLIFDPNTNLPPTQISEKSISLFKERWTEICNRGNDENFSVIVTVQPFLGSSDRLWSTSESVRISEKDFLSGRLQTLDGMVESLKELDDYCTNTIDLTNVFDGISEPIYVDGSHMYDNGNQIVAEEIFSNILPNIINDIENYE